jgi:hypothetical protein
VLGDGKFKQQIEQQLGYALPPFPREGDRKSKNISPQTRYRKSKYSDPFDSDPFDSKFMHLLDKFVDKLSWFIIVFPSRILW